MLEKKYEVYELADGSKHLNVIFDDEKYDLLRLVVEVNSFREWIKDSFDKVISGRVQYEEIGEIFVMQKLLLILQQSIIVYLMMMDSVK